jgi:hypothetical protein
MLAGEQEDGNRAERYHRSLHHEEHVRARPEQPQGCEQHQDRIDMGGQPRDLVAVQGRHLQGVAVRGRPHGLHHVPEVETTGDKSLVTKHRERGESSRIRGDPDREQDAHPWAEV